MLPEGYYKAVCKRATLSETAKGKEYVAVDFEIAEGEQAGRIVGWSGWFSEKAFDRTVASLKAMGWDGASLKNLGPLAEPVSVTVKHEEYNGNTSAKVAFVNIPKKPLSQDKADELERRLRERDPFGGSPF